MKGKANFLYKELIKRKEKFPFPSLSAIKKELLHTIGSIAVSWQILFFYLPIIYLFISSFAGFDENHKFTGISFAHFKPILNITYFKVILNSLLLSLATAIIVILIAFPLMYLIVFKTEKRKYLFLFLLIIPFWTNFLLHIYAWFFILEKNGLLNQSLLYLGLIKEPLRILHTPYASLFLMVYYYLPFASLPIFSALERFTISYFEASLTLGASKLKTFCKVVFPLTQKSIISGFFLVFIPAFGEFLIPELLGGYKTYYVGNVISLFFLGETTTPEGIAFTFLSISILLVCSFFLYTLFKTFFRYIQRGLYD
jgi:spermidine/putrescine transport system permease protein